MVKGRIRKRNNAAELSIAAADISLLTVTRSRWEMLARGVDPNTFDFLFWPLVAQFISTLDMAKNTHRKQNIYQYNI